MVRILHSFHRLSATAPHTVEQRVDTQRRALRLQVRTVYDMWRTQWRGNVDGLVGVVMSASALASVY